MKPLSRRTLLRGLGASLALPWLEAMLPARAWSLPAADAPRRALWIYVPNGVRLDAWRASKARDAASAALELGPLCAVLEPWRTQLLVLRGLSCAKANANGDGPGDHARAMANFLTGVQPYKGAGGTLGVGISADQLLARAVGEQTRIKSLELGAEAGRLSGQCDSGYPCAYSSGLAWAGRASPMLPETRPALLFDRLFRPGEAGSSPEQRLERARRRQSVLDSARVDAAALNRSLCGADRQRLDEYLEGVRQLERRVQALAHDTGELLPAGTRRPSAEPADYAEQLSLLCEMLVLAFATDTTRIATLAFANEGSNKSYDFLGVPEGHHDLSHHGGVPDKLDKLERINRFHLEVFAALLTALSNAREGEHNLLEQSLVCYGSGIADGNRHDHADLPILLAGRGGGSLLGGRQLEFPAGTPLCDLHLAMLARLGLENARLGDGRAALELG